MKRFLRSSLKLLPAPCLAIGLSSQALSQVTEIEPNDPCEAAQDVGPIDATGTFSVQGSLDTPPEEPDVDFFRFSATPGAQLVADDRGAATGMGTLSDPFLGLFDSDCNSLGSNDDAGGTLNSRLRFDVPSDGVFILAATSAVTISSKAVAGRAAPMSSRLPLLRRPSDPSLDESSTL